MDCISEVNLYIFCIFSFFPHKVIDGIGAFKARTGDCISELVYILHDFFISVMVKLLDEEKDFIY